MAQGKCVGIGDLRRTTGEVHHPLKVVGLREGDRTRAGVEGGYTGRGQCTGLGDGAIVARGIQRAAYITLSEIQRARGGCRQRARGQLAQGKCVGIDDLRRTTGEVHHPLKVVIGVGKHNGVATSVDGQRVTHDYETFVANRVAIADSQGNYT